MNSWSQRKRISFSQAQSIVLNQQNVKWVLDKKMSWNGINQQRCTTLGLQISSKQIRSESKSRSFGVPNQNYTETDI